MKRKTFRSVVVVTSLNMLSGQHQLSGILDFCLDNENWKLTLVDKKDFTTQRLQQFLKMQPDGFIIHLPGSEETLKRLLKSGIPTVLANVGGYQLPKGYHRISFFWTDNLGLGQQGAEYFLSKKGYRFFAFMSSESHDKTPDGYWSEERKRGFRDRLRQAGRSCEVHFSDGNFNNWLRDIPKPAAIMASCDLVAVQILESCRRLGISVPNEISILGVDDICTRKRNISSVKIDFRKAGQMEARELDRLMRGPNQGGFMELMIPNVGVLSRKSTALNAHSDIPIRALRFIAENAYKGIAVGDVVTHLGCSRRLAELRFRQTTKRTIRAEIERVRLIQARKLLNARATTLREVAQKCGYSSADILSRALARTKISQANS